LIQTLLTAIAEILQTQLEEQLPASENHFVMMPIADLTGVTIPAIALYPDNWALNQSFREIRANEPRPQELRQIIPINPPRPKTTYALDKPPLPGTVHCFLGRDRQSQPLQEGSDFTIDYAQAKLTLTKGQDLTQATQITLDYAFAALSTVREFQQTFWIDIYAPELVKLEQLSSLITGILINSHDSLVAQYNTPVPPQSKTEYQTSLFTTAHSLREFCLLDGTYMYPKTGVGLHLQFSVAGQICMTRAIAENIIPIQRVVITGDAADQAINTTT